VSDKPKADQDQNPEVKDAETEEVLANVDSLLAEADPEFLKALDSISEIDPNAVNIEGGAVLVDQIQENILLTALKSTVDYQSNLKTVVIFWTLLVFAMMSVYLVWINKKSLLHQDLFIRSLEKIGTPVSEYNPNNEVEPFYDNPRFVKNLVTIDRLIVNLKPSENSSENPMLVVEVTIEGLSTDAIIEIKDRQAEYKDLMARHTEEKKYDELVSAEGKRALTEQYRDLLNANLTQGQVRRVMLKSFILKP
jgi:flagellar basal body-associated protein FliL